MAGCPILADSDIYTIEDFVLKDNIISTTEDILKKFNEFVTQSFKQRKEMVEEQIKILRKITIDKIFEEIFKGVLK